ncbi:hypothetical protein [Ichthyenterobacterium magnum]|uniref:Tetratricopeptide repeat protein n=1 Tax=Ichthyenterobacterium magnum TaxID=1230530 RepID=A0A420DF44_9FLAO|nr:hypothetical protein [Ichthyenterobacterium magnum]RKE90816.1 hypothetical protein BXY80_2659 [Ichthyenterobacterium magnum]
MKTILLFFTLIMTSSLSAQTTPCNCCTEKHAEFDFWIGEWTVTNPDGTLAGTNSIEKIQDNCILRENWASAKGKYTGTSNNFYNYKDKQWEQVWIDNQGGSLHLKGNRVGNQMILKTDEEKNKDGQPFYHRVTWTLNDDGSVRQYWETITNNKDIIVAFDGLYKKK